MSLITSPNKKALGPDLGETESQLPSSILFKVTDRIISHRECTSPPSERELKVTVKVKMGVGHSTVGLIYRIPFYTCRYMTLGKPLSLSKHQILWFRMGVA